MGLRGAPQQPGDARAPSPRGDGPRWPLIGVFAATIVIGPIFVHGIASRTLEGLARVAEGTAGALAARVAPSHSPSHPPSA